jgi:two-component system chemotaxis sensor kinase CheA
MNPSEYKDAFMAEARENLENLNRSLLILEKNPAESEAIKEIFRAAHTIKGMSATMGYEPMARLSHEMESALEPIRTGRRVLTSTLVDTLFTCLDQLDGWIKDLAFSDQLNADPLASLLSRLQSAGSLVPAAPAVSVPPAQPGPDTSPLSEPRFQFNKGEREVLTQARSGGFSVFQVSVVVDLGCAFKEVRAFMVLRNINALGEVLRSEPPPEDIEAGRFGNGFHLVVVTDKSASDIENSINGISEVSSVKVVPFRELPDVPQGVQPALISDAGPFNGSPSPLTPSPVAPKDEHLRVSPTVRVHTSKLDRLMALAQELVIAKIRFEQTAIVYKLDMLQEPLSHLHYISSELQNVITEVRLIPVQVIFERFPRMVRDLSKKLGKEVELVTEGGDIELDRTIVDEMSEPLLHLLRNAVDHGIETPEERSKKGKPRNGTITLSAKRDRSYVLVTISDDGKGIDPNLIREKAVQKGLLAADEAEQLTDDEALRYISTPGFSTKAETTSVSGRGVGVDVAKTRVESLGGSFQIRSEKGRGTSFLIRFPLTLAIVKALLVKVADEVFAVPVGYVVETVDIGPECRRLVQQQETILLRDEVIPLYHLRELLEMQVPTNPDPSAEISVIIAEVNEARVGLQVDEILGQSEIALKPLDRFLKGLHGFAGVTILGDGHIALILDLLSLLEDLRRRRYHAGPVTV